MRSMMKHKIITGIFTVMLLSSFLAPQKIDTTLLEGKWINKEYMFDGDIDVYTKVEDFPDDKGGYEFLKGGILTVRQNSGWCGTPPIHYQAVTGTWKKVNDSVIHIEHPNWRGTASKDLHIISLTGSEMRFKSYSGK